MLSQKSLKKVLTYHPNTGVFIWLPRMVPTWDGVWSGRQAGLSSSNGRYRYTRIKISKKLYMAHRLAWLYVYGCFPPKNLEIDHINGDRYDNRIKNLRLGTRSQNMTNRSSFNSNGFKGVKKRTYGRKKIKILWEAQIRHHNKLHHLGCFKTPEEAHAAYCREAVKRQKEFARFN